ncbi:MAG TPA: hypothetical protein VMS31_08830, partial [Pyrinomonadaceae bacterium]|nr:hypothetical protein [Pyrinomonadaceae bacterium]
MPVIPDNQPPAQDEVVGAIGLIGLLTCRLKLAPFEVHLWQAKLDNRFTSNLQHVLSDDEKSRASRFHFDADRNDFIAARGLLRTLLSAYLEANSEELRFGYADNGKPYLEEDEPSGIKFNLA